MDEGTAVQQRLVPRAMKHVFIEGSNCRIRNIFRRLNANRPTVTLTKFAEAAGDYDVQTGGSFNDDDCG